MVLHSSARLALHFGVQKFEILALCINYLLAEVLVGIFCIQNSVESAFIYVVNSTDAKNNIDACILDIGTSLIQIGVSESHRYRVDALGLEYAAVSEVWLTLYKCPPSWHMPLVSVLDLS